MTLLGLVIVLIIVGVLLWGLSQFPAIDPNIKKIIYVVVVVALVLWLVTSLGGENHSWNPRLW